ncbi:MAG: GvpL/GvpF family gas vesicle protein, partial [Deltaproteobacteria bacterium]|nr:GvpL/GvpF family gas vesicle protein [Deltaproteobacteria bacterium]
MDGRYIYCITDGREDLSLGKVGIEKAEVYTVPFCNLLAVVHNCEAKAYYSENGDAVINWVITHQQVVDEAWKRFGTALPITFNTIIKGSAAHVRAWLKQEYETLCKKILRFRG